MLMTKNKQHLQQLLNICTNWANRWKLKFSPNKSKTLTNQTHAIGSLQLQGHQIQETENRTYKYLGIPFTKTGIDVRAYYRHIKRNMRMAMHEMTTYCEKHQVNYKNRILLYKTTIRSQVEYGVPIINYSKNEMKRLENIQIQALQKLMKIHRKTAPTTTLAITNIQTLQHRMDTLKIKAYLKMKQNKECSLSHDVQTELRNCTPTRNKHTNRVPPHTEVHQIMYKYRLEGLNDYSTTLTHKEEEINLENYLRELQNIHLIHIHKNQCKRAR